MAGLFRNIVHDGLMRQRFRACLIVIQITGG
jgi:hypothetical protein